MKVLCFGSLNIDYVYQVPHFVQPGETLSARSFAIHCGGKGLNQSVALARAGLTVCHAGKIGEDGRFLMARLAEDGVDTRHVQVASGVTGHAIIQVSPAGENCILLHGGNNLNVNEADRHAVFQDFGPGDVLLIQNEVNDPAALIQAAKARGMQVMMNPAPMDERVAALPLDQVDLLILNEIEGEALTGQAAPADMATQLRRRNPQGAVLITVGAEGAWYFQGDEAIHQAACPVKAVDTTAAGDTFTGFFAAGMLEGLPPAEALALAAKAAALCVTRPGAADAIPHRNELNQ